MYNINIPGIPDLSNLDLSQFNLPQPAPAPVPAPVPEPALAPVPVFDPAQFNPYAGMTQADMAEIGAMLPPQQVQQNVAPVPTPEPTPAPAPEFDPYVGMTQADLAEIGMVAPLSQTLPAPAPAPQPSAPSGIETVASNFAMTEDFMLPADQQALMPSTAPAAAPQTTSAAEPDVSAVAQSLIPSGVFDSEGIPDLSNLDLSGLDLSGFVSPQEGATFAQTARGGDDLSQIPGNYFTGASDYYTDGQLADMGIEPGTAVSTGANPQQPAGTQIDLTPEQQGYIDAWIESNPAGSIINTPVGNISLPELSQYTGGGSSPTTNVNAAQYVIQNLVPQASETARGGRVATTFGGPVNAPQQAPRANPFQRPEDGGIASLVPSGG